MKPQISTGKPARIQYGVAIPARRSRPPNPSFRDVAPLAPDLDETCWFEAATGAAVEIRSIADSRRWDRDE
jgi:hypothetical protein